jgi:hypothetical protein
VLTCFCFKFELFIAASRPHLFTWKYYKKFRINQQSLLTSCQHYGNPVGEHLHLHPGAENSNGIFLDQDSSPVSENGRLTGARLVVHIGGCQCESNAFVLHIGFDESREIQGSCSIFSTPWWSLYHRDASLSSSIRFTSKQYISLQHTWYTQRCAPALATI